jgi:hypothetical protein
MDYWIVKVKKLAYREIKKYFDKERLIVLKTGEIVKFSRRIVK